MLTVFMIEEELECMILHYRGTVEELVAIVANKYPTAHWEPSEDDSQEPDVDDMFILTCDEFDAGVFYITDKEGNFYVTEITVWEVRENREAYQVTREFSVQVCKVIEAHSPLEAESIASKMSKEEFIGYKTVDVSCLEGGVVTKVK